MKTAVVTTSYANNYGALLQTYALQRFLNENLRQDAVALAYCPPWGKAARSSFQTPRTLKDGLAFLYKLIRLNRAFAQKRRWKANKAFVDRYIRLSEKEYDSDEDLQTCRFDYDRLICGSDQIWNVALRADKKPHPAFFLQFARDWEEVEKIAYAPSVAEPIPEAAKGTVRDYLRIFDALSVRETSDVEIVRALTDKPVSRVLDPVFLLSPTQWSEILPESTIKEKYILCYFLSYGNFSDKVVKKLRETTGYKVINCNINIYDKFGSDVVLWDADAADFVSLVKNASYVCTNSFHCVAFSMIFRKNFVVVDKGWASSRMRSLQTIFGIEDRFVTASNWKDWIVSATPETLRVDYSLLELRIQDEIDRSTAYLKGALRVDR